MSSLWTPEGEHRVPRGDHDVAASGGATDSNARSRVGSTEASPTSSPGRAPTDRQAAPDREALAEEIAEIEKELAGAPARDVVANHCYGLFQLAALHLGQAPPRLDDARLSIDALAAIVETLGDRLGESAAPLRDGLAQIRLAFVQIAGAAHAGDAGQS